MLDFYGSPKVWAVINCLKKAKSGYDYFYYQLTAEKIPLKKLKKLLSRWTHLKSSTTL